MDPYRIEDINIYSDTLFVLVRVPYLVVGWGPWRQALFGS